MNPYRISLLMAFSILGLLAHGSMASAQSFDSTSNGEDGALSFAADAGVIDFDPSELTNDDGDPLDPDGDNVFHFSTIDIPTGTTVRLTSDNLGGEGKAVVWLATGDVTIDGVLDLDGAIGHDFDETALPSTPGAGGYSGGAASGTEGEAGNGPGGGEVNETGPAGGAGHLRLGGTSSNTARGALYGNRFLLPLVGGSGGAAGTTDGGGAGGGAILIASSGEISIDGTIQARGGAGNNAFGNVGKGGGGSGGAVRLMAVTVSGSGEIRVDGGAGTSSSSNAGSPGRIRVEAYNHGFRTDGSALPLGSETWATPGIIFLPDTAPQLRVASIDGIDAPDMPTGSFESVDVTIDSAAEVTISLEAENIPTGTTVTVTLFSEDGTTNVLTSTGLSGTLDSSTATADATFPSGYTRIVISAQWDPE